MWSGENQDQRQNGEDQTECCDNAAVHVYLLPETEGGSVRRHGQ